jgi:hypothetical protein
VAARQGQQQSSSRSHWAFALLQSKSTWCTTRHIAHRPRISRHAAYQPSSNGQASICACSQCRPALSQSARTLTIPQPLTLEGSVSPE